MFAQLLFLCSLFYSSFSSITEKPSFLKTCNFIDPELTKCSTEAIQGLFDELNKPDGVKGLEFIGNIDPMKIKRLNALTSADGPVAINATLTNVVITGFRGVKIVESVINRDVSWDTTIFLPRMKIDGRLKINGRILVIPLNGKGNCTIDTRNMNIKGHTKVGLYEKDGHKYYNVTDTKINFSISKLKVNLQNLFNGLKELEDSTNDFLNENWETALEALRPIITKSVEDVILDLLQKIFHNIPADFFVINLPDVK